MNKVAQYYRELVASLSERLRNGERDIDALVEQARERVIKTGELTRTEVDELTRAVRRDLVEFAMSYEEILKAVIEEEKQDKPERLLELLLDTEKAFGRRRMER